VASCSGKRSATRGFGIAIAGGRSGGAGRSIWWAGRGGRGLELGAGDFTGFEHGGGGAEGRAANEEHG